MSALFKKLNLGQQQDIVVLKAPASFGPELDALQGVRVHHDLPPGMTVHFALAFVISQSDLDQAASQLIAAAEGDALLWFAYPKKSSKTYHCEFNRDQGWEQLGRAGYEGVRMVAIDQDWSALRMRKQQFIRSLSRDPARALSAAGKQRAAKS